MMTSTSKTTEKVKRPPQTVMFAECKAHPGRVQLWFPSHSIIYSKCHQCETITSYDFGPGCVHYDDHYTLYEIEVKRGRGETWEAYWDRAQQLVLQDLPKYLVKK